MCYGLHRPPSFFSKGGKRKKGLQWVCPKTAEKKKPQHSLVFKKPIIQNPKLITIFSRNLNVSFPHFASSHISSPRYWRTSQGAANAMDSAHLPTKQNTYASLKPLLNPKPFHVILCWEFIKGSNLWSVDWEPISFKSFHPSGFRGSNPNAHEKQKNKSNETKCVFCRSWQFNSRRMWPQVGSVKPAVFSKPATHPCL